jgi:hypothetical protein
MKGARTRGMTEVLRYKKVATMTRSIRETLVLLSLVVLVFVLFAAAVRPAQQTAPSEARTAAPEQPSVSDADQALGTVGGAETDEDLQQLIAQAEALAGSESPASDETIALITEELEMLKAGLALKASLLDEGQDTSEADLDIASSSESLQAAIAAVTEPDSSVESSPTLEKTSDDRGTAVARAGAYVIETLSLLSKIQELLLIHRDGAAGADSNIPSDAGASQEDLQDVTGVVMETGEPLEGVSVTDPESGVTAVTDAEGHYELQGVPAGRPARLVLSKAGTQVGEGQLDLAAGRDGVGDFELKPSAEGARPSLRVLPYVAVVRGTKNANENKGSLTGTLRGADGKPVPRALVSLGTLARARTNSKGQYAFLHVPAGAHELKVFKPGFPSETQRVRVAAARVDAPIALRSRLARKRGETMALVRAKGSDIQMRGAITSAAGPPIRAAKVTLLQSGKAVSVRSGPRGDFLFSDLQAGRYRVLVSKPGYQSLAETVSLEPGASRMRSYQLKRRPLAPVTSKPGTGTAARAAVRPNAIAGGRVVGRVFHATTRAAVRGAVVILRGHEPVRTNAAGTYRILNVSPTRHRVVVKKDGFTSGQRDIAVSRGRVARLDFPLTPERPDPGRRR